MLERANPSRRAERDEQENADTRDNRPGWTASEDSYEGSIDNELQAAIEYKIAVSGVSGAERVLELLNLALLRLVR